MPQCNEIFKQKKVNDCVQHIILQKFTNFHAILSWSFQNICNEIGWPRFFAPPCSSILSTSVGSEADPSLQAVSPQVTSHKPGGRRPLLSTMSAVTFPAEEHHNPLASTNLYCLVTEAQVCEQLAQGRYMKVELPGVHFLLTTLSKLFTHMCLCHQAVLLKL